MIPKWRGTIEQGKLELYDWEGYNKYLSNLQGEVNVIVEKQKRQRSLPQNNWYWGVAIKMIAEETGYTPQEIHSLLKTLFLKDLLIINGEPIEIVKSTTELDTKKFSQDYWQRIQVWAAETLNLNIPNPDEIYQ
jgi:hypothetical protein